MEKPIPTTADGTKLYYAYGGYNAMVKGDLVGYPAPGSEARLVVGWQRISSGGAGSWGRTDEAFQILGAPWIDAQDLVAALRGYEIPGVDFEAIRFAPARFPELARGLEPHAVAHVDHSRLGGEFGDDAVNHTHELVLMAEIGKETDGKRHSGGDASGVGDG